MKILIKLVEQKVFIKGTTGLQGGLIYMNTLKYFRDLEDANRGDKEEGMVLKNKLDRYIIKLALKGETFAEANLCSDVDATEETTKRTKVFCLHMVDINPGYKINLDKRNCDNNTRALVIYDIEQFLFRIETAIKEIGDVRFLGAKSVEYRNDGPRNVFVKNTYFQFQEEYRIALMHNSEEQYELKIADLSDISFMIDIKDLYNLSIELESQKQTEKK